MKYASIALALLLVGCSASEVIDQEVATSVFSSATITDIEVGTPLLSQVVQSPLVITGKARGTWFFEASFPVRLVDDNGNVIANGYVEAQSEWMTTDFVPFSGTLTFTTTAKAGTLMLLKSNPSGLPEREESVRVPVRFQ